jgi:hypothetical protein
MATRKHHDEEADNFSDMYSRIDHEKYWRGYKIFKGITVLKEFTRRKKINSFQIWKLGISQTHYVLIW